jgi:hypothetical protein
MSKEKKTPVIYDINGKQIFEGEEVYYARKSGYTANGTLVKTSVVNIKSNTSVSLKGGFRSTYPSKQLAKVDLDYVGQ